MGEIIAALMIHKFPVKVTRGRLKLWAFTVSVMILMATPCLAKDFDHTNCKFLQENFKYDAFTWTGECVDGKLNGQGVLKLIRNNKKILEYIGGMNEGKFHGAGTIKYSSKNISGEGVWDQGRGLAFYVNHPDLLKYLEVEGFLLGLSIEEAKHKYNLTKFISREDLEFDNPDIPNYYGTNDAYNNQWMKDRVDEAANLFRGYHYGIFSQTELDLVKLCKCIYASEGTITDQEIREQFEEQFKIRIGTDNTIFVTDFKKCYIFKISVTSKTVGLAKYKKKIYYVCVSLEDNTEEFIDLKSRFINQKKDKKKKNIFSIQ